MASVRQAVRELPARASLRRKVYLALNPTGGLNWASLALILLILAATALAVLETEPMIADAHRPLFQNLEIGFGLLFGVEYLARLWSAPEGNCSRWRYARSPASIIDLVVVLSSFLPLFGSNMLLLRIARVLRMLRIARLGRFSRAFGVLGRAVRSRASELGVTAMLMIFFLLISATLLYWVEGGSQPDDFGSIPRSLWWATVTMTTVGYGDVVPASAFGKLLAGCISISGIVLIAIPTGIIAASFTEELAAQRRALQNVEPRQREF